MKAIPYAECTLTGFFDTKKEIGWMCDCGYINLTQVATSNMETSSAVDLDIPTTRREEVAFCGRCGRKFRIDKKSQSLIAVADDTTNSLQTPRW